GLGRRRLVPGPGRLAQLPSGYLLGCGSISGFRLPVRGRGNEIIAYQAPYHSGLAERGSPAPSALATSPGGSEGAGGAMPSVRDARLGPKGTAGGSSPRSCATRAVTSPMIAAGAARSGLGDLRRPAHCDRSTGGPATVRTVLRGNSRTFLLPYGRISWVPQCATGITGAPVVRASLATPVLATIGHRSGSRVAVASG